MPAETKQLNTVSSFKYFFNKDNKPVLKYYCYGRRNTQILHTRLRTGCSSLNLDLFLKNITDSPLCNCGSIENAKHDFFHCRFFQHQRTLLLNDIRLYRTPTVQMVGQKYPTQLQLNKVNSSDTEAPFLDLNFSITNGIVSPKIYDKRDDFNFEIVNFPFLDGDVPRSPSYGVYISQLIRFARVCSNVDDFNNRNLFLTAKLLKQGYRYHKIRKAFSKFYHRHSEFIVKYNIGLKTLLQQGISEPIFYGNLAYKFKRIVGKPNLSDQFKNIVKRFIRVGYNLDIM